MICEAYLDVPETKAGSYREIDRERETVLMIYGVCKWTIQRFCSKGQRHSGSPSALHKLFWARWRQFLAQGQSEYAHLSLAKQGEVLNKRDKPSKSVVWSGRNDAFQDYVDILLYFRRQDMQQDRTLVTQRKERNKQNDHRMIGSELPKQLPSGIKVRCPFSSVT